MQERCLQKALDNWAPHVDGTLGISWVKLKGELTNNSHTVEHLENQATKTNQQFDKAEFFVFLIFNVYLFLQERAGEGNWDRETQNPKQTPGSELSGIPDKGEFLCIDNQESALRGRLGGSVGWAAHSWFHLRSWSQSSWVWTLHRALCSQRRACFRSCLPHSAPPLLAVILSLKNK